MVDNLSGAFVAGKGAVARTGAQLWLIDDLFLDDGGVGLFESGFFGSRFELNNDIFFDAVTLPRKVVCLNARYRLINLNMFLDDAGRILVQIKLFA